MEELKLIMSMIENLSGDATTAFIWWLVMDKGLAFVTVLGALSIAAFTVTKVVRMTHAHEVNKDLPLYALQDIARKLGVPRTFYYDRDQIELIHKKIAELERRAALNYTTEK